MLAPLLLLTFVHYAVSESRENKMIQDSKDHIGDAELVDLSKYLKPQIYKSTTAPVSPMAGPLYNFIVNICNVLLDAHFSKSRIQRYMGILSKCLKGLGTGYLMKMTIRRLAKVLRKLSNINSNFIRLNITNFKNVLSEETPKKKDLFKTWNSIYTLSQDLKMDAYIYRLKQYGRRHKRRIGRQTREIFDKLIFYTIKKQDDFIKNSIQIKFISAILEYMENH